MQQSRKKAGCSSGAPFHRQRKQLRRDDLQVDASLLMRGWLSRPHPCVGDKDHVVNSRTPILYVPLTSEPALNVVCDKSMCIDRSTRRSVESKDEVFPAEHQGSDGVPQGERRKEAHQGKRIPHSVHHLRDTLSKTALYLAWRFTEYSGYIFPRLQHMIHRSRGAL